MTPKVNNTGKILNIDEFPSIGFGSAPKLDINMTMNGSIWNKKDPTKQDGPSADDKALMAEGETATDKANQSTTDAKGWTERCKNFIQNAANSNQSLNVTNGQIEKGSQQVTTLVNTNMLKMNALAADNAKNDAEIAALEAEKNILLANSGPTSTFSLQLPTGPKQNGPTNGTQPQQNTQGTDDTQQQIAQIDSKIGAIVAKSTSNSAGLQTIMKSTTSSKTQIENLFNQASKQLKQTQDATAQAQAGADTAQTISTITTVVGGVTTAVGVALAAGIFTAPAAPPPLAGGAAGTAAGAAGSAAASGASAAVSSTVATAVKTGATLATKVQAIAGLFTAVSQGTSQLASLKKTK